MPHEKENLDHQNNDVGRGYGERRGIKTNLKNFMSTIDSLRLTDRSFRLGERLPTPCMKGVYL